MADQDEYPKTQMGVVQQLRGFDHCFLGREYVHNVLKLFPGAVDPSKTWVIDHHGWKGLSVPGKKDGEIVYGADAADLAESIAASLGAGEEIIGRVSGRGSRLVFACEYIELTLRGPVPEMIVKDGTGKSSIQLP